MEQLHAKQEYVIETNLYLVKEAIVDHESRIIKVPSWDDYCNMFSNYDGSISGYFDSLTELDGASIPANATIEHLHINGFQLRCRMTLKNGWTMRKLAYRTKLKV